MERYGIMPMLSGNDASTPMELEGLVNVRVQRTLFMVLTCLAGTVLAVLIA